MVNRIVPGIGPENYKTYALVRPKGTHMRKARCEEVGCPNYFNGWKTVLDPNTVLGKQQANYIEAKSGKHFTKENFPDGRVVFVFQSGQQCFHQHEVAVEREPLYVVKDGDWRGNPRRTQPRRHSRPEDWVEDFALHQQNIERDRERG